jgi:hypothetical protein
VKRSRKALFEATPPASRICFTPSLFAVIDIARHEAVVGAGGAIDRCQTAS